MSAARDVVMVLRGGIRCCDLSIDLQIAGHKQFYGRLVRALAAPVATDYLEYVGKRMILPRNRDPGHVCQEGGRPRTHGYGIDSLARLSPSEGRGLGLECERAVHPAGATGEFSCAHLLPDQLSIVEVVVWAGCHDCLAPAAGRNHVSRCQRDFRTVVVAHEAGISEPLRRFPPKVVDEVYPSRDRSQGKDIGSEPPARCRPRSIAPRSEERR